MGVKGSIAIRRPKEEEIVTLEERHWRKLEEKSEKDFDLFLESCNQDITDHYDEAMEEADGSSPKSTVTRGKCCYC